MTRDFREDSFFIKESLMALVLILILFLNSFPVYASASDTHVIYQVEWLSDTSAKLSLQWSDETKTTPIMISSWSVNDDGSVTIKYAQGNQVADGYNVRVISDQNMKVPCIFRLEENVAGGSQTIFPDIGTSTEGELAINHLYFLGVINGYTDGTFKPEGKVSRAEFSKMLYKSAGMTDEMDSPIIFSDVADTYWAKHYIDTLASKGIVKGKGNNIFDPLGTISIAEVLTIIDRSFYVYGESSSYPYELSDHWSNEYFVSLVGSGVVKPGDDFYYPYNPSKIATRQECAVLLSRVLSGYFEEKW